MRDTIKASIRSDRSKRTTAPFARWRPLLSCPTDDDIRANRCVYGAWKVV